MAAIQISPGTTRIGWIGTGVMGTSMCSHLIEKGFSATVYNRTQDKAKRLLDQGAQWAAGPREVAQVSDVVFSIVGFPADVRQVILGENGALAGCESGNVLVDMTTSDPSLAIEIAEAAVAKGVHSVDAPVSGGDVGAREARLSIMIGGENEVVGALQPCWEAMGKTIVRSRETEAALASRKIPIHDRDREAIRVQLGLVIESLTPGLSNIQHRTALRFFDWFIRRINAQ